MDGKHVVIISPIHSGSDYFNYKHSFSIVLLALIDRNFFFMYCDIGARGRISDGGVFRNSTLYEKIYKNTINLPQPTPITNNINLPYVFLANNAFPLHENIMKSNPDDHPPS